MIALVYLRLKDKYENNKAGVGSPSPDDMDKSEISEMTNRPKMFKKPQNDFFLKQSQNAFRLFDVKHLKHFNSHEGRLFLMMFLHVQKELINFKALNPLNHTIYTLHETKLELIQIKP